MALTVKGSGVIMNTSLTSIDLAADTAPGDVIIVAATALAGAVTDGRMTEVTRSPNGATAIWTGIDDGGGDTLPIEVFATPYSVVVWAVLDKRHDITGSQITSGVELPTVASTGSPAVVAVAIGGHAVVPGRFWLWDDVIATNPSPDYAGATISYWSGRPPSPEATWSNDGNEVAERICTAAFAISDAFVAPPCRLFPRSDSLGVGSGRHYPPAKSQQRSGRRFGYY